MSESATTVGAAVDFEGSFRKKLSAAVRERMGPLRGVAGSVLEAAVDRVVDHAAQLLDAPVGGLLSGAWARHADIQKLCDAHRHAKDEETLAELARHRFDWQHQPSIELALNDLPAISIPLLVSVGITITGGVLVVQGGRLREVRGGKGAADVTISLADHEIGSRKAELPFPRVLQLPDPPAPAGVQVGRIATPETELANS